MPLLEVDDVVVQFGGVTAVEHAGFVAEAGRITGLIGPNGAGKTTCFNVISGLQKPNHGTVRFNGRSITRLPVHRRSRRGMGRTFQRLEAFGSLTVRDNVRVARDIHRGLDRRLGDRVRSVVPLLPLPQDRADSGDENAGPLQEPLKDLPVPREEDEVGVHAAARG